MWIRNNIFILSTINKNVVVMKGPSNIEIWSEEVLNDYFKGVSFESLADAFDGLKTE